MICKKKTIKKSECYDDFYLKQLLCSTNCVFKLRVKIVSCFDFTCYQNVTKLQLVYKFIF